MRKAIVSAVIAGVAVFGVAACSGSDHTTSASDRVTDRTAETVPETVPDTPTGNELTGSWTSATESIVLSLIRQQPALNGYAPSCVLDQIETEYATPQEYIDAAESNDDSITSVAVAVFSHC